MVEPNLGDVCGEPLRPPPERYVGPRLRKTAFVVFAGYLAAGVAVLLLAGLIVMLPFWIAKALAHGPAEWIQRGQFKNAAGELCCGERDCFELLDDDVKITASGYYVVSIKETIPFHEATPSPDGKYWRCQWGGLRKCFFAPPGAA